MKINSNALEEVRKIFRYFPQTIATLEEKLKEREEELINFIQINGDHLHFDIFKKGPSY